MKECPLWPRLPVVTRPADCQAVHGGTWRGADATNGLPDDTATSCRARSVHCERYPRPDSVAHESQLAQPIHYVLLVRFDDQNAYVHDTDKPSVQTIPLEELRLSWNVNVPAMGKKNRLVTFSIPCGLAPDDVLI